MKKRILSLLLVCAMMLSLLPMSVLATKPENLPTAAVGKLDREAQTFYGKLFDDEQDKTYTLNALGEYATSSEGRIAIPESLPETYPVFDVSNGFNLDWNAFESAIGGENCVFPTVPVNEFVFAADQKEESNEYDNWYVDFTVSLNRAVAKDSMGLVGYYSQYQIPVGFFAPANFEENQQLPLLNSVQMTSGWTYSDIKNTVKTFVCGAFNTSEANIGATLKVQLRIFDPEVFTNPGMICDSSTWKDDENTFVINEILYEFTEDNLTTIMEGDGTTYCYAGTTGEDDSIPAGAYYVNGVMTEAMGAVSVNQATAYYKITPVAKIGETEYTSLQAAVNAATEGQTITLLMDASGNGVDVAGDKNVIFDFDGHTYTLQGEMVGSSGTKTNGFRFLDGSTVTLKNGKLANGATTAEGNTPAKVMVNSYANLTLKDFSIDGTTAAVAPSGNAYGTAALYINNKNTEVEGSGTYTGDPEGYVIYMANVEYYSDDAVLTFDKTFTGTVSGKVTNGNKQEYSIAVENGKFAFGGITLGEGAMKLTGGVYTTNVSNYVAPGYACVANTDYSTKTAYPYAVKPVQVEMPKNVTVEDNKFKVGGEEIAVEGIGGEGQPSADQAKTAIEAVLNNENVSTFADTNIDEATPATKKAKDQAAGFNLSMVLDALKTEAENNHSMAAVAVSGDAEKVTLAQTTVGDTDVSKTISIDMTKAAVTTTTQDAQSIVSLSTTTFDVKPVATIVVDKGEGQTETIKAVIPNEAITAPITFRLPVPESWTGMVTVYHEDELYTTCAIQEAGTDKAYIELSSRKFSQWTIENEEYDDKYAVAKTNTMYFDDLAEALEAATDGQTVTVLKDGVELKSEVFITNKAITLDLNDFTVTVNTPSISVPIHVGKTNSTQGAELTVQNGTISGTTKTGGNVFGVYGMTTDSSVKRALTLDDVTMNVTGGYAVAINDNSKHGYGAEVTIKDSTLKAPYVLAVNGNIQDTTGNVPKVTLNNAKITATTDDLALYAAGYAKWDIVGSTITGGTGLYAKSGKFDINGGKIEGNGAYAPYAANGNGGHSTGDGIFFDSKTGYAGNMEVSLTNVNVSSVNGYAVQEALTDKTETNTRSIAISGGTYTSAVGKAAIATSEAFDRSENTTLTVSGATGVPSNETLGQFTSFSVDYGDGVDYSRKDKDYSDSRWSQFVDADGGNSAETALKLKTDGEDDPVVNFATEQTGQQLIVHFGVTMGTVSYYQGTPNNSLDASAYTVIHDGETLALENNLPVVFQIECGSGVTRFFTFTPDQIEVSVPYILYVRPLHPEANKIVDPTPGTEDDPKYVQYGIYAAVPNGAAANSIGSYNFEISYNKDAFEYDTSRKFALPDGVLGTVEVENGTNLKVAATLNGEVGIAPEEILENATEPSTYYAQLGTLTLKVKSSHNESTIITSIVNENGVTPVVTPKGYDKNKGTITVSGHAQYLIGFSATGATVDPSSEWVPHGEMPGTTLTQETGWTLTGGSWNKPITAATAATSYHYTAIQVPYTVTWNSEINPMTVMVNDTPVSSGDTFYYNDSFVVTVNTEGNKVVRNGDFKVGTNGESRKNSGNNQFGYEFNGPNNDVVLSYTTTDYVTVTFDGGDNVDLKNGETAATALSAITRKDIADALYASVDDFIKGNAGDTYTIPNQVPKANARLVPPDALTDTTKQQWKISGVTNPVANSTLEATPAAYVFSADTTLTADAVKTHVVTFAAGTNGSINNGETTTYHVDEGESIEKILNGQAIDYTDGSATGKEVKLPATTPNPGYKRTNWTAPEGITEVNAAITITANFEVAKFSLSISGDAAFKNVTGRTNGEISQEENVTFKLTPKSGKEITEVRYTVADHANGTTFEGKTSGNLTADADGFYKIPKEDILGDVTVTVSTKETVKVTVKSADTSKGTVGGTTVFVVDKHDDSVTGTTVGELLDMMKDTLIFTAEPGYAVEKKTLAETEDTNKKHEVIKFYTDENCTTEFKKNDGETADTYEEYIGMTFSAATTLYVNFVDAEYSFTANPTGLVNAGDGITAGKVTHDTDAKFTVNSTNNIISSVTYSVVGGVQNVLLAPEGEDKTYTIPGDRIIGNVTVNVTTLADEVFGNSEAKKPITALFIYRDSTMAAEESIEGEEGSAYMANVVQNMDMKILALVSEAFLTEGYTTTNKFFQLANGTQLYWSARYSAYVCWVPASMTAADLNGYVKFEATNKTVSIVNGGDINFDGAVNSADAGIVNDALHGTRLVPTSALQLFEMDVANTTGKTLVLGATIDADDVTWILQKTVGQSVTDDNKNPLIEVEKQDD